MPTLHVDIVKGCCTAEQKETLIMTLADTISTTMQRPRNIVRVFINEYDPADFSVDGYSYLRRQKELGETHTVENSDILISVLILQGRSAEQKQELIANITTALETNIGFKREWIRVFISDLLEDNFGNNGVSLTTKKKSAT